MKDNIVIDVKNVNKVYKLYNKPIDRLKESLNPFGRKYHSNFHALRDISFSVKEGETLGIIGKNGAGKSTLLKIIAGVLSPTSGKIHVQGRVTSLLELGAGFNPELSGEGNIYLYGTLYGYSKKEMSQKIDEILEFADIGEFAYKPVKLYSSGMFARLAFSVMVHLNPDILIVDEALSVGDTFFQHKCNIFMKEKMKNVTKLLVTHDMSMITNLADNVIVLGNGSREFEGKPLDAIEYYTKSIHDKAFGKVESSNSMIIKDNSVNIENWNYVDESKLGGALEGRITAFNFMVNSELYKGYIKEDDLLGIDILIKASCKMDNIIIGYIVSDRYGNYIFGENTHSSGYRNIQIEENCNYSVRITLYWPEIKEGEYFVTLGLGNGLHEINHTIQCWAHNVIQLKSISPDKTIHCLFNNKIKGFSIKQLE